MATTINRTPYNALVDDDGTNLVGTPWTKNSVKTVLLDEIDVALATLDTAIASFSLFGGSNVLELRSGTNAQDFLVYNTTNGTDKEFVSMGWSGNVAYIHTRNAGAGVNRSLAIGTNGAGSLFLRAGGANNFEVTGNGKLLGYIPGGGLGYGTGAGGAVTQITSKATGVTLNKVTGQITMQAAALAGGAKVSFVVTDSAVAATDTILVAIGSGGTANAYRADVTAVAAGSFTVTVENITAGSLSEAPVINFAVLKAVAA